MSEMPTSNSAWDESLVLDEWKQCADLSIYEAAFWIRLKFDPRSHAHRMQLDDAYSDQFMQHPGGFDAVLEKLEVIRSAIRSGLIGITKEVLMSNGHYDCDKTYISKSDWLRWCEGNGLHDLALRFGHGIGNHPVTYDAHKSEAVDDADGPKRLDENSVDLEQATLERKFRGCKRMILEHWPTIRCKNGPDADGIQVHRHLKVVLPPQELPSLKTVRNCLSTLKKKKLLP
jgi:hypothetical protein